MDLIDIFKTFHPNAKENTFFSSAHGTFSRILNVQLLYLLGMLLCFNNAHLSKGGNYKKKTARNTNPWKSNNTFPNNYRLMKKSKGK